MVEYNSPFFAWLSFHNINNFRYSYYSIRYALTMSVTIVTNIIRLCYRLSLVFFILKNTNSSWFKSSSLLSFFMKVAKSFMKIKKRGKKCLKRCFIKDFTSFIKKYMLIEVLQCAKNYVITVLNIILFSTY